MRVTSKGQVTIPQHARENMGIITSETEVEFILNKDAHWYLKKMNSNPSRFRTAHTAGKLQLSTDEILALTRWH